MLVRAKIRVRVYFMVRELNCDRVKYAGQGKNSCQCVFYATAKDAGQGESPC